MKLTYRKDYQKPSYKVEKIDLDFTIDPENTIVKNKMVLHQLENKPLVLNGQHMELLGVWMDGKPFDGFELTDKTLTIKEMPKDCVLEIHNKISPKDNSWLAGLYMSNGVFCTQCEPEGFRNITYYFDHPDVLSMFTVSIHADRKKYPVVLSNGNKVFEDENTITFVDPFAKPCYLFALVAGDLGSIKDEFTTCSGRHVDLTLYCEKGKENRLLHAMESLKKAMKWDEERFGREYDLDLFSIVAISDFNAGAMENKSLNIFNDSCLLADKDTATDATFTAIEGVVGHEYFHNWSGDRVTARDWFNLSLKEGFTVYRDQEFSADMQSKTVQRMDDVNTLKLYQFPSDDGPLKHPVRPDSFATIENFYTTTIYEKGAELIRMQEKIVGWEGFRKGTDLYFSRHDGQAVTIDDFVKCIEDANGVDLSQFMQWYSTAGRPTVEVFDKKYDDKTKTYSFKLKQYLNGVDTPFVIPLDMGLVSETGKDLLSKTLLFNQMEQEFVFENISEKPVLSINRNFTSPITLKITYTDEERYLLIKNDTDLFNRYEVGQEYAADKMVEAILKKTSADEKVIDAFGSYLSGWEKDPRYVSRAILFPSEEYIGAKMEVFDIDAVSSYRKELRKSFAKKYEKELLAIYQALDKNEPYQPTPQKAGERALKNVCLGYLSFLPEYQNLAEEQYEKSDNLTDRLTALSTLINHNLPTKQKRLSDFHKMYDGDHLVINKWLTLQALADDDETLDVVKSLMHTSDFNIKNPNKVRSLIGGFSHNLKQFHRIDGEGYKLLSDIVLQLDKLNPQMAERMSEPFSKWKLFDKKRQDLMKAEMQKILSAEKLSVNVQETIGRILKEEA